MNTPPQSPDPFVVSSLHSFRYAQAAKAAARRKFAAMNEEKPKLPSLFDALKPRKAAAAGPAKPAKSPPREVKAAPAARVVAKPAVPATRKPLGEKTNKPSSPPPPVVLKKAVRQTATPPTETRIPRRKVVTTPTPTKAPTKPAKTIVAPQKPATARTRGTATPSPVAKGASAAKQLVTPPPTPPLQSTAKKPVVVKRADTKHVDKKPKTAAPVTPKALPARKTPSPTSKKVASKVAGGAEGTSAADKVIASESKSVADLPCDAEEVKLEPVERTSQPEVAEADVPSSTVPVPALAGDAVQTKEAHAPLAAAAAEILAEVEEPSEVVGEKDVPVSAAAPSTAAEVPDTATTQKHVQTVHALQAVFARKEAPVLEAPLPQIVDDDADSATKQGKPMVNVVKAALDRRKDMPVYAAPALSAAQSEAPAVASGIHARMAALFGAAGVAPPPAHRAPGAFVRKLKIPELRDSQASQDARTQREVEALRSLRRVDVGSRVIVKTGYFGGDGPANVEGAGAEGPAVALSCLGVIERVRRARAEEV